MTKKKLTIQMPVHQKIMAVKNVMIRRSPVIICTIPGRGPSPRVTGRSGTPIKRIVTDATMTAAVQRNTSRRSVSQRGAPNSRKRMTPVPPTRNMTPAALPRRSGGEISARNAK